LFDGAVTLISVFLAALVAVAFGTSAVHGIGWPEQYALAVTMAGIGLLVFIFIRGALVLVDTDVDFHPVIERLGGALTGLGTGLLIVGFASLCVLSMPVPPKLAPLQRSANRTTDLVLAPCRSVATLVPGAYVFELDNLLAVAGEQYSSYVPPPPPPPPPSPLASPDDPQPPPEGGAPSPRIREDR